MEILILSLITASIVLIITKSAILGNKREFVKERYEAAKVLAKTEGYKVGWIHIWWAAMWNCPMCLGFWVAAILCYFNDTGHYWWSATLMVFLLNWLIHCVENLLFQTGYFLEHYANKDFMLNLKKYLKK